MLAFKSPDCLNRSCLLILPALIEIPPMPPINPRHPLCAVSRNSRAMKIQNCPRCEPPTPWPGRLSRAKAAKIRRPGRSAATAVFAMAVIVLAGVAIYWKMPTG
jgi:hypothetical protein